MSTQGGLKHVATEPSQLDAKRERRRGGGAAGRAAALRRAPSDSDCSGETASLSADSAERVRAVPPPVRTLRSGKARSRRRGSEWEVLEGLKDGQRFDRRPEVFNGYLHKKRKWPLKGWHKRFFVIDGGILVYARSPTDVARGRLHGSVDVGLSVISAKARRRRIDIDADEFIYHLRAKTTEFFRTWLNVLKAHRLYRQHLLTFGARESVPKIHAPLEDLPPVDSSNSTLISAKKSSTTSSDYEVPRISSIPRISRVPDYSKNIKCHPCSVKDSLHINDFSREPPCEKLSILEVEPVHKNHRSLCSMKCMQHNYKNELADSNVENQHSPISGVTATEKQMLSTELDKYSLRSVYNTDHRSTDPIPSTFLCEYSFSPSVSNYVSKELCEQKLVIDQKSKPTTALFIFAHKRRIVGEAMRRSKKCTNLVKYRNLVDEPTLKKPLSRSMLLGKYKMKVNTHVGKDDSFAITPKAHTEVQVGRVDTMNKSLQDVMTVSDYDHIAETLITTILENHATSNNVTPDQNAIKFYLSQMVSELYEISFRKYHDNPVKALFRCLLEYWLKNTSIEHVKEATKNVKSVDIQSNFHFVEDKNLSGVFNNSVTEATQCNLQIIQQVRTNRIGTKHKRKPNNYKLLTESYEKDRHIQQLERLLKNTVYVCETICSNQSKEKDIKITRKLIDNLGKLSKKDMSSEDSKGNSNSSTELPEIQETINNLISETSIPPSVAKEFLGAYLEVLLHDSSKIPRSDSTSPSEGSNKPENHMECSVQGEPVQKKVSKSITTLNKTENLGTPNDENKKVGLGGINDTVDSGQLYLSEVLDKITTIFSKVSDTGSKTLIHSLRETKVSSDSKLHRPIKNELGEPVGYSATPKSSVLKNNADNAIVIDLSEYDLEHMSMFNDPSIKGMMSLTIKLKEKKPSFGEKKCTNMNFKLSDHKAVSNCSNSAYKKQCREPQDSHISLQNPYLDNCPDSEQEIRDFKPFFYDSDATSKDYFETNHGSEPSLDLKQNKTMTIRSESKRSVVSHDDPQSCYIISSFKTSLAAKFQSKKKVRMKDYGGIHIRTNSHTSMTYKTAEVPLTEKDSKAVDEKFIFMLLENLTTLSQSVPSLHKDINNLYTKLKKKYEKLLKENSPRLGLLGKIYSEDSKKITEDKETQVEHDFPTFGTKVLVTNMACTTTSMENVEAEEPTRNADKCLSAYIVYKNLHDNAVQTDENKFNHLNEYFGFAPKQDVFVVNPNTEYFQIYNPPPDSLVNPLSKPSFYNTRNEIILDHLSKPIPDFVTQRNSMMSDPSIEEVTNLSAAFNDLNRIFQKDDYVENNSVDAGQTTVAQLKEFDETQKHYNVDEELQNEERWQSPGARQHLINELKLVLQGLKVSTQSQMDQRIPKTNKDFLEKDFNINQMFINQECISSSKSVSSTNSIVDTENSAELMTIYRCSSDPSHCSESGGPLDNATRELGQAQLSVQQLQRLLDALELHQIHHDTDVSLEGASPNVKKDRRKFGLRKKKSNTKCASVELAPPQYIDPSSSHMALSTLTAPPSPGGGASSMPNSAASLPIACAAARPQSLPGAEALGPAGPASLASLTPDQQLREDFTVLAKDLLVTLKGVVSTLVCERGRLRAAMDAAETTVTPGGPVVTALRTNLTTALQQNSELRSRLSRIHDASDLAEMSSVNNSDPQVNRQFQQSLSYSSSCVSASEFFDAEEHEDDLKPEEILPVDEAGVIELDGDSSSEAGSLSSEEGSASSDNSDGALITAEPVSLRLNQNGLESRPTSGWSRRTRLPCPRPTPGGPSLWNLLYKNIGKDLSQISMPVTINEPLNMLQRLCEELEYSELLDTASECKNAVERMALIAAFAVSAYAASAHRAASKPFNPLLAETYECIRDDRSFRFLAEQVSHHPPISACHAESPRWWFWQEARLKTKFWGKSMEFQPTGRVHVRLASTGDHYSWNKVTTCVHNLFGGQRWVDQYGDMHITCHGTDISAKLNFIKASSWSSSRHEVRGAVTSGSSGTRLRLQGRWSEALYAGEPPAARCLWRPGAMPPEHELYYGFTRFAMELNEMEPGMRDLLPHTDTRFRPDQRALEEGDVEAAEQFKLDLEQAQRERRRDSSEHSPCWFRKTLESGEETWVFTGEYWKAREAGFHNHAAPRIW